jgi:8-amino-7-oxononanoate synthase
MTRTLDWIDEELAKLERDGLLRRPLARRGPQAATISIDSKGLVNFGANDYLGLANDERLKSAAIAAIGREGWGAGASPLITGRSQLHAELEHSLAAFEGTESALVFPSGFAANAGTVAALADRGDCIFADEKNHASLIDGCRLSRANVHVYRHCDVAHAEELVRSFGDCRRRLIVTDALFSMDGDLAPLADLAALAREYDCMFMVDEAHATGVFGDHGRGVCECLGVEDTVHVRVGTLSKALGCSGGFVAGPESLIRWLYNRARPYVFSTAHPAANSAAAIAAIDIVQQEPARRTTLLARAQHVRNELSKCGWNVGRSTSQIIPLVVQDVGRTMHLTTQLREVGLFVPGIRPPSVPAGQSLLRISLSYGHTDTMIERLLSSQALKAPPTYRGT